MLSNGTGVLLLALVGVVGLALGAILALLFTPREQKTELPPKLKERNYTPALQIWREPAGRRLALEMDGKFFVNPAALTPEKRQFLIHLVQSLQSWVEHSVESSRPPESTQPDQPITVDSILQQDQPVLITPPPTDIEPAPASIPTAPPAPRPPTMSPVAVEPVAPVVMLPGAETTAPAAKPLSIVGQIDAVLQEILASSPLRSRGIRLVEDGHEGVIVWVGLEHFSGIEAVPYSEVKQVIRQAVAEWERRSERDVRR